MSDRLDTNSEVGRQNALSLAALLGIEADEASALLDRSVIVSHDPQDVAAALLARQTLELLSLTLTQVSHDASIGCIDMEVVIGGANPLSQAPKVHVHATAMTATIGTARLDTEPVASLHPATSQVVACYISAVVIRLLTGDSIPNTKRDPVVLDLSVLGIESIVRHGQVDLGRMYLVGAGAVGNGFLWGLRQFDVSGQIDVVDYDVVDDGNLNRQIWFRKEDVGYLKAGRLVARAQPSLARVMLKPRAARLQELSEKANNPTWLRRLVVAVDSPRARRSLQCELPREVFDASTTDVREIVLHFNKQPTDRACLGCIYPPGNAEDSRARHIAEALGVTTEMVAEGDINANAATMIANRYSDRNIAREDLVGLSYESLFKALCAKAALHTPEGRQVFAPFGFVSVLAGTLLAIETVRRIGTGAESDSFNLWKVNPWLPFSTKLQRRIKAVPGCSVCGDPAFRKIVTRIWSVNQR